MSNNSDFYDNHVKELNAQYLAVSTEDVHKSWISLVQKSGRALDVGTGVGRDAGFLAEQGYMVTAVDASANMLEQAKANFPHVAVNWLIDMLPSLIKVRALGHKFEAMCMQRQRIKDTQQLADF